MSNSREKLIEQAVAKSGAKLFKVNADTLNRAPRPAQLSVTVIDEKPVVDIRPGDYQRDSITRDLSRAAPAIEQASEVFRALADALGIPQRFRACENAFRSATLHVQMVGRALRPRRYTWRMTRSKQPRRVKIYQCPPHVIDYGVEPPIVRDAKMQAICDNWEVPRG